jgi:fatty-acyl-CoA synthase
MTFDEALDARASARAHDPFLLWEGRTVRFGEVAQRSRDLAAALAQLGVEAGDRVALLLPGRPEFVVSLFALSRLGAIAVPLDPGTPTPELRYLLRHSEAVAVITMERYAGVDFLEAFETLLPGLPELQYLITVGDADLWYDDRIFPYEDLLSSGAGRKLPAGLRRCATETGLLHYTSGPTGKPRGVLLSPSALLAAAQGTVSALGLTPHDRVVGVSGLFHVFALGPGILGSALAGSALILQPDFEPEVALDLIEQWGATVHYGIPTVFASELLAQRKTPRDLRTLRVGLVAGAPMLEELHRAVEAELCPSLLPAYSLVETASVLAINRPHDPESKRRQTVGRPLASIEVRVLDEDGSILPVESLGEVAVRGPGVMQGYYRQPRATALALGEDGFFRTGDLGMVDEEGYLHLVGRRRDVILRSGSNIHPGEIEDRIQQHPAVEAALVVGVRDEILGEAVSAAVVPVEGALLTSEELREWCAQTLPPFKVPDRIHFMDFLPTAKDGSFRRVELVRLLEAIAAVD